MLIAAGQPFLALPFPPDPGMHINGGWLYYDGGLHRGIDYVLGTPLNSATWRPFAVLAAADGQACQEQRGRGNWVRVRHQVGGLRYSTLYGHLAEVAEGIPPCASGRALPVRQGDRIGTAGATGVGKGCAPLPPETCIHLHFALEGPDGQLIDPYGLYAGPDAYPDPGQGPPHTGYFLP